MQLSAEDFWGKKKTNGLICKNSIEVLLPNYFKTNFDIFSAFLVGHFNVNFRIKSSFLVF